MNDKNNHKNDHPLPKREEVVAIPDFTEAMKKELIETLTNELKVLRAKIGITQQELADKLGVSRQTYGMIENKTQDMNWSQFLALTFLFRSNQDTSKLLEWTGAFTPDLERYIQLHEKCTK
jgi:DNA-binding XRE family transcriptional regulator